MLVNPLKKRRIGEKSRKVIKPTSLGKEQNKSKTKLKGDDNQIKKISNKALLSTSMEVDGKKLNPLHYQSIIQLESKYKKNSPIKKKPKSNHTQSGIIKAEFVRKRQSHSVLEGKKGSKQRVVKSNKKSKLNYEDKNPMRTVSGLEAYPAIPDQLMLGFSSSQMLFSSYGQSRDEMKTIKSKKPSFEDLSLASKIEMNAKCQYFRKERAVIKIQKIWRGYQTRKILDLFLDNQISRLSQKLHQPISNRIQSLSGHQTLNNDPNNFYEGFVDTSLNFQNNNHASISHDLSGTLRNEQFSSIEISNIDDFIKKEPKSHPHEKIQDDQLQNEQQQDSYNEYDSDQQIPQFPGYIRQRPIHSHEQLNEQLRGIHKQDQSYQKHSQGQEQNYYQQIKYHHPEIIIETNQQHIQSRKSSMQHKTNRLFDHTIRRISTDAFNPANTISQQAKQYQKEPQIDIRGGQIFQTIQMIDDGEFYKQKMNNLKELQINKWETIINYIKRQIKIGKNEKQILEEIIQISQNNKRYLENIEQIKQSMNQKLETQIMTTQESKVQAINNKQLDIQTQLSKKRNLRLQINDRSPCHTPNQPLISNSNKIIQFGLSKKSENKQYGSKENRSGQIERMQDIKQDLLKKQGFNSAAVDQIISLRENILKQWQKSQYQKIYEMYKNKKISEQALELRLFELNKSVQQQRSEIEKNKKQIQKGLKVATKVFSKVQKHFIGKKMGISKSAQSLNHTKLNSFILLNRFDDDKQVPVFVDEGRPIRNPRSNRNFFVDQTDSHSDELDFTDQQYRSFSRPQLSNQFVQLNRNIIITQQFLRGEPINQIQQTETKEQIQSDPRLQQYVNQVSKGIQTLIINQISVEYYKNSKMYQSICNKFDVQFSKPKKVLKQELNKFIDEISSNFPDQSILIQRLNQQICPPPLQLLKCMRVDLYPVDYDDDQNIQDVGKYEFIIPQNICIEAIEKLSLQRILSKPSPRIDAIDNVDEIDPKLKQYLQNRQKLSKIKQKQVSQKSKQVFQSQMHCVFDCWNQQIIIAKSQIQGFSGIGLNEGTLSLEDQNKLIEKEFVEEYINQAKKKLLKIINQDSQLSLNKRIDQMAYDQICTNEGSWVCYTDQALGFILELDFVIFEDLMVEMARIIHKKCLQTIDN